MDRKQYLELCRACAVLPNGEFFVKKDVPDEYKVVFQEKEYYPAAYELSFDQSGKVVHKAILHFIGYNSIVIAELDRVTPYISEKA